MTSFFGVAGRHGQQRPTDQLWRGPGLSGGHVGAPLKHDACLADLPEQSPADERAERRCQSRKARFHHSRTGSRTDDERSDIYILDEPTVPYPAAAACALSRRWLASGKGNRWGWMAVASVWVIQFSAIPSWLGLGSRLSPSTHFLPPPVFWRRAGWCWAWRWCNGCVVGAVWPGRLLQAPSSPPGAGPLGHSATGCAGPPPSKKGRPPAKTNPSPPDPGLSTPSETVPVRDRESSALAPA